MSTVYSHQILWFLTIVALMLVNFPVRASDAKIVFDSDRGEHGSKIYVMNTDGAVTGPIGSLPGGHADPKFSPDNRHIVFAYYAPGISGAQIYVMNADGSQPYALTSSPNTKRAPQFTQGSRIVYWTGSPSSPWCSTSWNQTAPTKSRCHSIFLDTSLTYQLESMGWQHSRAVL